VGIKRKKVTFFPDFTNKDFWPLFEKPEPIKNALPDWYRKQRIGGEAGFFKSDMSNLDLTFKACIPFYDSLTCGYYLKLPMDIQVHQVNGRPRLSWNLKFEFVVERSLEHNLPTPLGCSTDVFGWKFYHGFS
jgi:hypothetical protein